MRSLLKDVSMDELYAMRNAGMTNADIAKSLGVSYETVLKHIGKQPGRGSKLAGFVPVDLGERAEPVVEPEPQKPEVPEPVLPVVCRVTYLEGEAGKYTVNSAEKTVTVGYAGGCIQMSFDDLDKIIAEMAAISRKIHQQGESAEMW